MKKILIVYPSMMVGGSTTSLLSILNNMDYSKYEIDLLLLNQKGKMFDYIPKKVKVLPFALGNLNPKKMRLKKMFSINSWFKLIKGKYYDLKNGNTNVRAQIMQEDTLKYCKPIEKQYDIAISFLEGWALYYVSKMVKANKKISWIHLDYRNAKLKKEIDKKYLQNIDNVILVSDSCKKSFDITFPEYINKSLIIENILSDRFVKLRAAEKINYFVDVKCSLNFVTCCRLVLFHKGLDRGILALGKLKKYNQLPNDFKWYIIGIGPDFIELEKMIQVNDLSNNVILCGEFLNPLPLIKQFNYFFLPSRYEGKPMAITEAQMLGLVPIVTNYSSAKEQIINNVNGYIIDNDDNCVYEFLKKFFSEKVNLIEVRNNITKYNYDNLEEFKKIESLLN